MPILDLAAWGVVGVGVQGLAQGLRQKPLNYKPVGYLLSGAAFVGIGYLLQGVRAKQNEFLNSRADMLSQERRGRGINFSRE